MIDAYLGELDRLLRADPRRRRRILAEVRAHLEDAGGDAEAIERFGSAAEVAGRFNELEPVRAPRLAALLAVGGALLVFAVVQGLERFIPPAPWPSADAAPGALPELFYGATVTVLVGVGSAVLALVVPRDWRIPLVAFSCIALLACIGLLTAHAVERADYVPDSPSNALVVALGFGCALAPMAGLALLTGAVRRSSS